MHYWHRRQLTRSFIIHILSFISLVSRECSECSRMFCAARSLCSLIAIAISFQSARPARRRKPAVRRQSPRFVDCARARSFALFNCELLRLTRALLRRVLRRASASLLRLGAAMLLFPLQINELVILFYSISALVAHLIPSRRGGLCSAGNTRTRPLCSAAQWKSLQALSAIHSSQCSIVQYNTVQYSTSTLLHVRTKQNRTQRKHRVTLLSLLSFPFTSLLSADHTRAHFSSTFPSRSFRSQRSAAQGLALENWMARACVRYVHYSCSCSCACRSVHT